MKITPAMVEVGAVAAVVVLLAVLYARKGSAAGVGQSIGETAGGVVAGAAGGLILGIGDGVGVPATNQTECERLKAAGDTWGASFACPAGDFIGWWWKK